MKDLSKLQLATKPRDKEIDPIKIFNALTLRGEIQGLFGPQQEALVNWHQRRSDADVLFSLNTGGGKTLVGLLAAQSLVNETKGKILYVCPTNQLIEQTAAQAADCGIRVATYFRQNWTAKELFDTCQACCVTNYYAVFNGFSKFLGQGIKGLIFDDAHVAPGKIRECFTIKVDPTHPAWGKLMSVFRGYFEASPFVVRFNRFVTPSGKYEPGVLFVPGWFVYERRTEIAAALEEGGVASEDSSKFPYAHLSDHLRQCGFFVSQRAIEITPTVLPTHKLPYFNEDVRRLYMTATLPTRYESIRTFGLDKPEIVAPSGKAGAAQRLFIFANGKENETIYDEVRRLAAPRKACIITPSGASADKWKDFAKLYDSDLGNEAIQAFRRESKPVKIILAALYDGIDLPGKSCNVLILDGLARGSNLHDQFLEESLDITSFKASNIATRTTQSIGRIFRSNTDHGVVILANKAQQSWLMDPANLSFIPPLLQQQIRLGLALKETIEASSGDLDYPDLMEAVIDGRPDWDSLYNNQIGKLEAEPRPGMAKWGDEAALQEYKAFEEMWNGRYEQAANILKGLATEIEQYDSSQAAWYLHWSGVAYLHAGLNDDATSFFWQASNKKLSLGRPAASTGAVAQEDKVTPGAQALRLAKQFGADYRKSLDSIIARLKGDGGKNAEDHEEALKELGNLLGFTASRPDAEEGKGPDVLWDLPEDTILVAMEAKTQKESPKVYKKNKHIGKVLNDCNWLAERFPGYERRLFLIGPLCGIAPQASPPPDLRVMPISEFIGIAERLISARQNASARTDASRSPAPAIQSAFSRYGLLWPNCVDALDYRLASDLQEEKDSDD